jgi:hypothetical protein
MGFGAVLQFLKENIGSLLGCGGQSVKLTTHLLLVQRYERRQAVT